MKKTEFIEEMSKRCMMKPETIRYIYKMSADFIVEKLLEGDEVDIPSLGKFSISRRTNATYKNLFGNSAEEMVINSKYPNFRIGHYIRNAYKSSLAQ